MKEIIKKNLNGKRVLGAFVLTNLVYACMLLVTIPKTMDFSGGMKLLDMMPTGYNREYVNKLLTALGPEGRETYLYNQIPVDMIYPFLFGISYCLVLAYFLKKLNKLNTPLFYLCWLPILAGIFDYMENFGILALINGFPNVSQFTVSTTNFFTIVKSMGATLCFVGLIVLVVVFAIRTAIQKKGET